MTRLKTEAAWHSPGQTGELPMLDVMKLLGAYLVFVVHIGIPLFSRSVWSERLLFLMQDGIARVAVPFYFAAAGFLLFRREGDAAALAPRVGRYLLRILRLGVIWFILLPETVRYHLWYLRALLVAVGLLWLLWRAGLPLWGMGLLSGGLLLVGILGDSYCWLLAPVRRLPWIGSLLNGFFKVFSTTRNGLFMGLPYVFVGFFAARRELRLSRRSVLAALALCLVLLSAEVVFLRRHGADRYDLTLMLLPLSYLLLCIATHWQLPPRPIYRRMRGAGLIFFLIHLFAASLSQKLCLALGWYLPGWLWHLGTVAALLAFSFLLEALSETKYLSFLGYLYR